MKYGLITFQNTENIGDDIQSYAAIRFLPKIDYYIEREKLDLFVPEKKEKILTIMNGWFLHSKINFPISPYIYPIYISTHFSAYNSGGIKDEYLNSYTREKLNEYGPIGCRDTGTMKLLEKNSINSYFSGCLTLTIEKDKKLKKEDYICIVDIDKEAEEYLKNNISSSTKIIKKTHQLNAHENQLLPWEQRFKNVKELLDIYQKAKLVITSRLHCALPCLALETPVLLLYDEDKMYTKDRLSDYAKMVNSMSTKEFLNSGIEKINSNITNPKEYLKIRENVIDKVNKLIKEAEENIRLRAEELPDIKHYQQLYIEPKKNIDYLYKVATDRMYIDSRNYTKLSYEKSYWEKEWHILLAESNPERVRTYKDELNQILEKYEEVCIENKILHEKLEKYKNKKGKRKYE